MLNIDELIGEGKTILYRGKEYEVKEITLKNVLEANKLLSTEDGDKALQGMSKVTADLVPDLPVDEIPLRALKSIFNYIMDVEEEKN